MDSSMGKATSNVASFITMGILKEEYLMVKEAIWVSNIRIRFVIMKLNLMKVMWTEKVKRRVSMKTYLKANDNL